MMPKICARTRAQWPTDKKLCRAEGVDVVFAPKVTLRKKRQREPLTKPLCHLGWKESRVPATSAVWLRWW